MAVPFLDHTDPRTVPALRPAPVRRPTLVAIDGGRSRSGLRRQRIFLMRRMLVGVVALVALAAILSLGAAVIGAVGSGSDVAVPSTYQVNPGDTLWSIAGELGDGADRRQVVSLLAEANGGTVVVAGQRLVVPASVVALLG